MKKLIWGVLLVALGLGAGFLLFGRGSDRAAPDSEAAAITYDQAMRGIGKFFEMEESALEDGRRRALSAPNESLAMLELIGPRDAVERAALVVMLPGDPDMRGILHINRTIVFQLLDNVLPETKGEYGRRSIALDDLLWESEEQHEEIIGSKLLRMRFDGELETLAVFVELTG